MGIASNVDSALLQDDHAVGISSGQVQIVQRNQGDGPGTMEYYVYSALAEEVFAIENRSGPAPIRDRSGCPKFVVEISPPQNHPTSRFSINVAA